MSLQLLPTPDTKQVYYGGEVVKGKIRLTNKEPFITRSCVIFLAAFEKTEVDEYSVSADVSKMASGNFVTAFTPKRTSYKATRTFLNLQYIVLGSSWFKRKDSDKIQLNAGNHEYLYAFRLPQLSLPSVFPQVNFANEYQITYRLTAYLDSPSLLSFNRTTCQDIIVRGYHISPLALSSALSPKPLTYRASKEFTFESGRLQLRVTVAQRANFINDNVSFKVEVTNNSKKIVEAISIFVGQETKISAMGHTKSYNASLVLGKKLPLSAPPSSPTPVNATFSVKIPWNKALFSEVVATNVNISHFWKFELHVTSVLAMNLELKVPFMLFLPDVRPTHLRGTAPAPPSPAQVTTKTAPAPGATAKTTPTSTPAKNSLKVSVPANAKVVKMRFEFENGDVYDGEWLGNKQHGAGVLLYSSGDAFTGTWTHGYKVDGQYSFADPNVEYSAENVGLISQILDKKTAPVEYSSEVQKEVARLLELDFPIKSSQGPTNTCTFAEFAELASRLEEIKAQKETIQQFLPLLAHVTNSISGMLASPVNAVQVAIFGTAVHDHYGVFFLLWQYFSPHLVKKWAKHCLPHLTGTHKSTMIALLATALAELGENAEMLRLVDILLLLPANQTRAEVRAVALYLMATIYMGRLDFPQCDKTCTQALEACASDAYLLRAQIIVLALRGLRSSENISVRKGVKQLSTLVQRELYLSHLRDMYNGQGLFGNVAVALTLHETTPTSAMTVSCVRTMWQMGFLDGVLSIVNCCFNNCEPLIARCIAIASDLGKPYANSSFHAIMMQYMLLKHVPYDQIKPVFDWVIRFWEFSQYEGAVRSIIAYFAWFRVCTEAGRALEAVQALESCLRLFCEIFSDKEKQMEPSSNAEKNKIDQTDNTPNKINNNNNTKNNENNTNNNVYINNNNNVEINNTMNDNNVNYNTNENPTNNDQCNNSKDTDDNNIDEENQNDIDKEINLTYENDLDYESYYEDTEKGEKESKGNTDTKNSNAQNGKINQTEKHEELMDEIAVRKAVESERPKPSASCLYLVSSMCQVLVSAAPRVPRTASLILDLLACATRWAALGYEQAVLFTAALMHARARIHVAQGETRNAIVWWKNVLEVVDEFKNKTMEAAENTVANDTDQGAVTELEVFEEKDFAYGMLNHELEALANLGIYNDFPLALYPESLKWFQRLLDTVTQILGKNRGILERLYSWDPKPPTDSKKLTRRDLLLWDKKAVALRGVASSVGYQSTSYKELTKAKEQAEQAIYLGKLLNFAELRATTQQNTLARVTKKLSTLKPPSSPSSPASSPASSPPSSPPLSSTSTPAKPSASPSTPSPFGGKSPASPNSPVTPGTVQWIDASNITHCMRCNTEFGFFTRKHHCRGCGCVVCDACSPLYLLPQYGTTPHRTCILCKQKF